MNTVMNFAYDKYERRTLPLESKQGLVFVYTFWNERNKKLLWESEWNRINRSIQI